MTTEQLHRIIIGQERRCQDTLCERICRVSDMMYGYCAECWGYLEEQVDREKDELQMKLFAIARKLTDSLRENTPLARAAASVMNGPKVFERGVMAREVNHGAVSRVLAFAYDLARTCRNAELEADVLLLKSRL